jgi:hypothetical protein
LVQVQFVLTGMLIYMLMGFFLEYLHVNGWSSTLGP